jgi:hypothetical protein
MKDSEQRFLFRLLWPSSPKLGIGRAVAQKLQDLQALREDTLTEEEYAELRREVLAELSAKPRKLFLPWFSVGIFAVGFLALVFYAVSVRRYELIWITTPAILILMLSWLRRIADLRARNGLSRAARLAVLDELLTANSISPDEASTAKTEICRSIGAANGC